MATEPNRETLARFSEGRLFLEAPRPTHTDEWDTTDHKTSQGRLGLVMEVAAVLGVLLLLVAAIGLGLAALAGDYWGQLAILAAAGVLSLGIAWISRRRQAFTAASWLSAAGAPLISFCFLPAIALLGYQFSSNAEA